MCKGKAMGTLKRPSLARVCQNRKITEYLPKASPRSTFGIQIVDPPAGDTRTRLSVNQPSQSLSALNSGYLFLFSPFHPLFDV